MKIERASLSVLRNTKLNCPGGSVVKNLPANAGDTGLIPVFGNLPSLERSRMPRSN